MHARGAGGFGYRFERVFDSFRNDENTNDIHLLLYVRTSFLLTEQNDYDFRLKSAVESTFEIINIYLFEKYLNRISN